MKRKIFNKLFTIPILCFFLIPFISVNTVYAEVFELNQSYSISGSIISRTDGIVRLTAMDNRYTNCIDLTNYNSGTVTLLFERNAYGSYLISKEDLPEDLAIGYTFISDDFHVIYNVSSVTIVINEGCYLYVSYNIPYTATIDTGSTPPDPTPSTSPSPTPTDNPTPTGTVSPTPVPTGTPDQSGIYFHFDVPLDYYFIIIIILMGGLLICQLFKN